MAKKILAIFIVSILLCSYIIPTTSAKADVVVGDNDSYAVTELGVENGKKIATMEALLQLLESGVSEINFNNISDLEDYLEEFYDELNNIDYQDVSNEILAGAYNDVKSLKKWIDDRGEYIGTYYKDMLNSADQGLGDIFNHFNLKLEKTSLTRTPLDGIRGLSRFTNSEPEPDIPPDFTFIQNINKLFLTQQNFLEYDKNYIKSTSNDPTYYLYYPINELTITGDFSNSNHLPTGTAGYNGLKIGAIYPCITINVTTNQDNSATVSYSNTTNANWFYNSWGSARYNMNLTSYNTSTGEWWAWLQDSGLPYTPVYTQTQFAGLSSAINYIYQHYSNVNIYVNGEPWVIISNNVSSPTLDIDGFLKLFGNDNPIQYKFPQGTQIDYNALYTTIYNAIRDNLPLDMQTINNNQVYYDSHDAVYSPTIYNYYGKDGDDENDWIDSILDYATIPDFNSVLGTVAVLDTPFVNGITIVNAGVTDVIPTDILLIFGGFFVLVLFVCIINRMSE